MKLKMLIRKGFLLLFFLMFYSSTPPEPPSAVTHTVEIRNMKFVPAIIEAHKGDSVVFFNRDLVIHNVTDKNNTWASPTLNPKDSWTFHVKEEFSYYCSFHPVMRGEVRLKE